MYKNKQDNSIRDTFEIKIHKWKEKGVKIHHANSNYTRVVIPSRNFFSISGSPGIISVLSKNVIISFLC